LLDFGSLLRGAPWVGPLGGCSSVVIPLAIQRDGWRPPVCPRRLPARTRCGGRGGAGAVPRAHHDGMLVGPSDPWGDTRPQRLRHSTLPSFCSLCSVPVDMPSYATRHVMAAQPLPPCVLYMPATANCCWQARGRCVAQQQTLLLTGGAGLCAAACSCERCSTPRPAHCHYQLLAVVAPADPSAAARTHAGWRAAAGHRKVGSHRAAAGPASHLHCGKARVPWLRKPRGGRAHRSSGVAQGVPWLHKPCSALIVHSVCAPPAEAGMFIIV